MPLLEAEANKLTIESLVKGVIELLHDRGTRDLFAQLPFKSTEGSSYEWVIEKALPNGHSARDPYGSTAIPGGVGSRTRLSTKAGMLIRDADTAEIDIIGKSNVNSLHAEDIEMAAKRLAFDFRRQFISGNGTWDAGTGYNLTGIDKYLDKFAGYYESAALVDPTIGSFKEQKMFYTSGASAGTPYGTAEPLDYEVLDDLTTRYKGEGFDVIYSNRETANAFKALLNASPGNIAQHIMDERFGRPVYMFNGIPWVVMDVVGAEKTNSFDAASDPTTMAITTGDITVNTTTDKFWPGFNDLDIGRGFDIYDADPNDGGTVQASGVITDVTGTNTAETDQAPGGNVTGFLVLNPTNAIYCLRYSEMDGVSAVYHGGLTGNVPNTGEYQGPIAGFKAKEIGWLEDSPLLRTRLNWYGNFVVHSPYAIARLSHFTL